MEDKFLDTFADLRSLLVVIGKLVAAAGVCRVDCDDYSGIEMWCARH